MYMLKPVQNKFIKSKILFAILWMSILIFIFSFSNTSNVAVVNSKSRKSCEYIFRTNVRWTKTTIEIMELLSSLNKAGKTIIIVTHDLKVVEYCNKTVFIEDGYLGQSLDKS